MYTYRGLLDCVLEILMLVKFSTYERNSISERETVILLMDIAI